MARLPQGEKKQRANKIGRLLQTYRFGLTEQEISKETGLHRRTVNNYLRELDEEERAHRAGRKWFPG
jgi:DNA-binding transcriptional regulator LsrR (DeoR family)